MKVKRYAVVTTGGKRHIAWWWDPIELGVRVCSCRREPHWVTLCQTRGDLQEVEDTADCKRCYRALEREHFHIGLEINEAEYLREKAAQNLVALVRAHADLDKLVSPEFELQMEEAS